MKHSVAILTIVFASSLCAAEIPATQPSTAAVASTPVEALKLLSVAIARGDVISVRTLYQPTEKNAPTAQDFVDWDSVASKVNTAAQARWGQSAHVADLLSEDIPKVPGKLQLDEKSDSANFHSPNLDDNKPVVVLVRKNAIWQISSYCNMTSGDIRVILAAWKQATVDIAAGKYESAADVSSTIEKQVQEQMGVLHRN